MSRILFTFVPALLIFGFVVTSSRADTDYRCLNLCVNNGSAAVACRQQCAYDQPGQDAKAHAHAASPKAHKIFNAPQPLNGIALTPPTAAKIRGVQAKTNVSGKDYRCIQQCLQNGLQYQLCDQNCAKANCGHGSVLCKNTAGAVPENAFSGQPPQ